MHRSGLSSEQKDVISEYHLSIYINDNLISETVCTPTFLPELVVGRILTENGIKPHSIDSINVYESDNKAVVCSSGDAGDKLEVIPEHKMTLDEVKTLASVVNAKLSEDTPLHKLTRSSHSCFVIKDGEIIFEAEDIGRHNAIDKAVGFIYMNDIAPMTVALFTTGRMPTDMVRKVVRASVPVLISRQQPSVEGAEFAKSYNLTLIGSVRNDHLNIYSGDISDEA